MEKEGDLLLGLITASKQVPFLPSMAAMISFYIQEEEKPQLTTYLCSVAC